MNGEHAAAVKNEPARTCRPACQDGTDESRHADRNEEPSNTSPPAADTRLSGDGGIDRLLKASSTAVSTAGKGEQHHVLDGGIADMPNRMARPNRAEQPDRLARTTPTAPTRAPDEGDAWRNTSTRSPRRSDGIIGGRHRRKHPSNCRASPVRQAKGTPRTSMIGAIDAANDRDQEKITLPSAYRATKAWHTDSGETFLSGSRYAHRTTIGERQQKIQREK